MCKKNLVHGLKVIEKPDALCKGCLEGKQTRNPYPTQTLYKAKERLELIHADICGPISPSTPADEALGMFQKFRVLVENETGVKVKTLRTDRGGEFNSKAFTKYCDDTGLKRHFTAPYSPQQNGVMERRNRSVIKMARSVMKSIEVPDTLWGEMFKEIPKSTFTIEGYNQEVTNLKDENDLIGEPLGSFEGINDEEFQPIPQTHAHGDEGLLTPTQSPVAFVGSASLVSSTTGGGAQKRYRLFTDIYEECDELLFTLEYAMYTRKQHGNVLIVGVYVDDLIVTGNHDDGITLKQFAYARNALLKARMTYCNPSQSPMKHRLKLTKDKRGVPVNPTLFHSIIRGLRYLTHARPGIAYDVGIMNMFIEKPIIKHMQAVKRILRYIRGRVDYGLVYTKYHKGDVITGYSDSNHARNVEDRQSTGGMVFYLKENLVTWGSKKQ
nr:hypothetical protein [Tanacetum cinerariifolium]